jgi:CHAD domain-containing protein
VSESGETDWASPAPSAIPAALRALAREYRVSMHRPVTVRKVWLDSADWRLHRNGLTLLAASDGRAEDGTLELRLADGETISGPDGGAWPRRLTELPAAMRTQLSPVLDLRAVLPMVQTLGTVAAGEIRDGQDQVVARLVHERPATIDGSRERVPARLVLQPVRGHRKEAGRAARVLRECGLVRNDLGPYLSALYAAGLDPDAALPPPIRSELPATVAVARVLLTFLDALEANVAGTVDDVDTEFLHDLRVAVRRSRSAAKLLGDVLPPTLTTWAAIQLKWLGDLTTPLRDLDVHLLDMPQFSARLVSARADDLEPLIRHLESIRAVELRALVRGLTSTRFGRFRSRWRSALEKLADAEDPALGLTDGITAAELGRERLRKAERRVLRLGSAITPASPAEDLHTLRKRCKELRYLLEIFTPVLESADVRGAVKQLKGLQDVLGRFQDSEVQRDAMYAMAEDLMVSDQATARTLLAMGEIAARLHEDQTAARDQFAAAFARFATPSLPS